MGRGENQAFVKIVIITGDTLEQRMKISFSQISLFSKFEALKEGQ